MSAGTPQPLLDARETFATIRDLAQTIGGPPRVESAVLRRRAGRIGELLDLIDGQLDELAALAFEGLLDPEYRTIATCSACLTLAGHARSYVDGRPLCDGCKRDEISGKVGR